MSSLKNSRRLVLRTFPAREEAEEYALSMGWDKVSETHFDPDQGTTEEVMWQAGQNVYFYYTEENRSSSSCVGLIGPEGSVNDESLTELQENFDAWQVRELLDEIDSSTDAVQYANAIVRAALGAPVSYDEGFFSRICEATRHEDFMVRDVAVSAIAYPGWPEFRPRLREIVRNEPVFRVKNNASLLLESFDRVGVPES